MGIRSLLNFFIPEKTRQDSLEFSKAKQLVGIGLFAVVVILLSSIRPFLIKDYLNGVIALVLTAIMLVGIISFRFTGSRLISGNSIVFSLYVLLTLVIYNSVGLVADTANFVFVILLSLIFTGARSGIVWGVICTITTVGLYRLKMGSINQNAMVLSSEQALSDAFGSYLVLVIVTLVLGLVYETVSSKNLTNFETADRQSKKVTRDIQMVLEDVNQVMEAVANSDLSKNISSDLQGDLSLLKTSVNSSLELLSHTLSRVASASERLDAGAMELARSAQVLSTGTSNQAASLEEITSSMNEIESRVKINDDNASQSQQLTTQTLESVKTGMGKMEGMLGSINKISQTSADVSKVIKVIDEIAFQTNLLALNAAVEAARAGKYGKGFSVVAEEVRNLASRSAEAAKNTTELIENSIKEVEIGVTQANETAEALEQITGKVEKTNDLVSEIAAASKEQRNGIVEINRGLSQVNAVVMQNSSISEQSAAASETLNAEASALSTMMHKFKLKAHSEIEVE